MEKKKTTLYCIFFMVSIPVILKNEQYTPLDGYIRKLETNDRYVSLEGRSRT